MNRLLLCYALLCVGGLHAQSSGSISGRVVWRENGSPVRGAAVAATRLLNSHGMTWTGQDGRYTIEGLPPGSYQVMVLKPAIGAYGSTAEIRLGEITHAPDILIPSAPVLAGRVRDQDDLSVEGATVSFQRQTWTGGRPRLASTGRALTDDRGEFRIRSPASGSYFVALQPPSRPEVAGLYRLLHPPAFYPNALDPAEAQPVHVESGIRIETIDFRPPAPAGGSVQILAKTASFGEPPRSCVRCGFSVHARRADLWIEVLSGQANSQGRIQIDGLHPGVYRAAIIQRSADELYAGYDDIIIEKTERSRTYEIVAWSGSTVGILVTLIDPPRNLRDETASWKAAVTASLVEPSYTRTELRDSQTVDGKGLTGRGRFFLAPGEWALGFIENDLPDNAYVQETLVAGRPQRGQFITIVPGAIAQSVELRIGFASAKLTGQVSVPPDAGSRGVWVFGYPIRPGEGRQLATPAQPDGEFAFEHVPPGDYLLYSMPPSEVERVDLADPAIQARYANYSKRVTIAPGESKRIELEAIP